jgi:hypothetical protein
VESRLNEVNSNIQDTLKLIEAYIGFFASPNRDLETLKPLLGSRFSFQGPLGTFASAHSFLEDVRADRLRIQSIQLQQILVEGAHATARYEVVSADPEIGRLHLTEWFETNENRIHSIISVYDASGVKQSFSRI